jgi:capsular polysaccharide export protein
LPLLRAEDGFLRSFGTGDDFPSLSVVVDAQGIYYDSTGPSDLEALLASDEDLLLQAPEADRAMGLLIEHQLSKYNHAPHMQLPPAGGQPRVLVVDQTFGDMSVRYGAATERTFAHMLQAAIDENPGAQVIVKTHPEVSSGRKRGYLSHVQPMQLPQGGELLPLRQAANPIGLLQEALVLSVGAEPLEKRLRVEGVKTGRITALDLPGQIEQALGTLEHPIAGLGEPIGTRDMFETLWETEQDWMPTIR